MTEMPVRTPKQRRSEKSSERVLETAIQLLEQAGFEAFTVQEVSQRSGVSIGAIYARFQSKEELLRAVHRQAMDSMRSDHDAVSRADWPPTRPAHEVVTLAVRMVADVFRANQRLLSALMHLGAVDEEISRRGSEASTDLGRQFSSTVLNHREAITHPDPERAVDVAFRMAFCTFARQVMNGPTYESDRPIAWVDLVDEVGDACATYLLAKRDRPARRQRS